MDLGFVTEIHLCSEMGISALESTDSAIQVIPGCEMH